MMVLNAANYVKDGTLYYIVSVSVDFTPLDFAATCALSGTEKIIYNGTVYEAVGGTGIPAIQDTNFYTVYSEPQ